MGVDEGVDCNPLGPGTVVVPFSGGLSTITCNEPACAMAEAGIAATNCWLLTKVVTNEEPFRYAIELLRKSFPLMVRVNWPPPAVAVLGEIEATDGAGGQEQDKAVASAIASMHKMGDLAAVAIDVHRRQTGSDKRGAANVKTIQEDRRGSRASQPVRQIATLYAWVEWPDLKSKGSKP